MIHREEVNNMVKKKAQNVESGEDATPDTTPVSEEKATEEVKEPEAETPLTEEVEAEEEVTETEESPKRKGYSERVRQLNTRAKEAEEKAESLAEKLAALTDSDESRADLQPIIPQQVNEPLIKPGEEIDGVELDKRLRDRENKQFQRTDALIKLRTKQQDAVSRVRVESEKSVNKYPELNPEHKSFNRELSDAVGDAVEGHVKANPYSASVTKFVDKLMKPYKGAVAKEVGKVTEDLAKQVSKSAIKPTSVRKGEKSAQEKTIKELEDELGIIQA